MLTAHIKFNNGQESYRTVHRIEVDRDNHIVVVFDTPTAPPERIEAATIRVYIVGEFQHTYAV